jgi:cob(I)alamin adenosyltransferase
MKIYTKKGDSGETGLFGGERVPKDHLRIRTYGTLDELNSVLGLALAEEGLSAALRKGLSRVQGELFQLGAELATPRGKSVPSGLIQEHEILSLEQEIDSMERQLPPLQSFILPGGSRVAAQLHVGRTVVRRAERELVVLNRAEPLREPVLRYVNRLSDYLFVAARYANHEAGVADVPWVAPAVNST